MSRTLRASMLLLFLASCGGGNFSAPRHMDDACAVIQQRPHYLAAMRSVQSRWGVPISVQMAVLYQESKFIGNARTPHQFALGVIPLGRQSSAYGYAQALDSTWDDYRAEQHRSGARRDNIRDATDFMGWYIDGTTQRLGIPKSDAANQYLAYHEGRNGFARQSYKSKRWLVDVATRVGNRADMYHTQLLTCLR
ncbi:lytic transglycosylase [bacterium]|nr:lytic transglycosylase [bacterium]